MSIMPEDKKFNLQDDEAILNLAHTLADMGLAKVEVRAEEVVNSLTDIHTVVNVNLREEGVNQTHCCYFMGDGTPLARFSVPPVITTTEAQPQVEGETQPKKEENQAQPQPPTSDYQPGGGVNPVKRVVTHANS